jgi:hypothetical protein
MVIVGAGRSRAIPPFAGQCAAFVHTLESRDPDSWRGQAARDKRAPRHSFAVRAVAAGLGSNTAGATRALRM